MLIENNTLDHNIIIVALMKNLIIISIAVSVETQNLLITIVPI